METSGVAEVLYLDNNASTAPDFNVLEAMDWAHRHLYANPSSQHAAGKCAADAVELAREQTASLISSSPRSIVFTSGATEANGLAIRGLWEASQLSSSRRDTIVVGSTEHLAVLESARSLESMGARVIEAPVDRLGVIDLEALGMLITDRVLLVSVMAANNETGTLAPLRQISALAKERGACIHVDATQYVGRLRLDMEELDLDLVSLSGHKMHGPKGTGALAIRRGISVAAQIRGGGHERGFRSGTINTPGIVGLGVAAINAIERFGETSAIAVLRDSLHQGLTKRLDGVTLNGHPTERLPNTVNLRFDGADGEAIMASLRRVACSTGSACSSGTPSPSHVLTRMGLTSQQAHESLRFSLSRNTTEVDVHAAIEDIASAVTFAREMSLGMAG